MGNQLNAAEQWDKLKVYAAGDLRRVADAAVARALAAAGRPASAGGGAGGGGGGGSGGGGGVAAHVLATTTGLSSKHTISGGSVGQTVRVTGPTTAALAFLQHSDLGGVTADQHHAQAHALDGSDHTGTLSWAKVSKVGASLADLPTRLYSDLQSRTHSVVGSDHSIAGAQYSVVGATATNTLGLLTPVADASGGVSALLRSNAGALTLDVLTAATRVRSPLLDTASGDLTLGPDGTAVLPTGSILKDLGDYNRKWRTLFAAELYVETLVAQNVLATIGGRIMVAPTTKLIADVSSGATTIDVENNNLTNAYLYMATAPGGVAQVEVMKVTAGPTTISGGYRYTVTRNVDGSGANAWVAGDAVVNIGASAGQGWIDLTSTSTVRNHLGPTMAIYVRTGTAAWTDVKPVYAAGNLRSFVDYGADEYGFGLGNDLTLTPSTGFSGMTGDRTNGLRLFNTTLELYTSGTKVTWFTPGEGLTFRASNVYDVSRSIRFLGTDNYRLGVLYHTGGPTQSNGSYIVLSADTTGASQTATAELTAASTGTGGVSVARISTRGNSAHVQVTETNPGITAIELLADAATVTGGPLLLDETFGNAATPNLAFAGDPDTGLYRVGANQIGIALGGVAKWTLAPTGANLTGTLAVTDTLTISASLIANWNGPYYGYAVKADVGSVWARGLNFLNSSAALLGAFGAYGSSDALTYLYAGAAYNDFSVRVDPVNHRVGIGDNVTPTNALSVGGAADFAGNVTVSHASSPAVIVTDTTNSVSGRIAATDTVFQVGSISNHDLTFFSNNSTKATLSTGGDFTLSASGATLGAPNVNATTAFQRDGVAGSIFVPMTPTNLTDTGSTVWSGVSRAAGTYTFDVNTAANGSVPTEAVAVAVMGTFTWTNSNNSTYATIQKPSGAYSIVARATASAIGIDVAGVVQIDSSGQFTVTINNATSNTSLLRIVGYYI